MAERESGGGSEERDSSDEERLCAETELSAATLAALQAHLQGGEQQSGGGVGPLQAATVEVRAVAVAAEKTAAENPRYAEREYWEERFAEEESYEWLLPFAQCAEQLGEALPDPPARVLVVGCGNSEFSADLSRAGWGEGVVSIDYSEAVITRMREKHPSLRWEVCDMRDLTPLFADGEFAAVVDKAAMDALTVREGSVWDPAPEVVDDVRRMCSEVLRVLRPGGVFVQISFAQPHFRTKYLAGDPDDPFPWSIEHSPIRRGGGDEGCFEYFMYTAIKQSAPPDGAVDSPPPAAS